MPIIQKCLTCDRYDKKNQRLRNRLRCSVTCEAYKKEMIRRAQQYNLDCFGDSSFPQEQG